MRKLLLLLALAHPIAAHTQIIDLPAETIEGAPVSFKVRDLPSGDKIEVQIRRITSDGSRADGRSIFTVGPDGAIDPARDPALEGDYTGIDASGPFWSLHPGVRSTTDRGTLRVQVRSGERLLTERTIPLRAIAAGIDTQEVAAFPGARLYRPLGTTGSLPVIIVLGGSEGGSSGARSIAPRLAELGYAALALPYYNPGWSSERLPGLPSAFVDIPVDRLEVIKRWIDRRSDLNQNRIGLYGVSKGGEFAMIAASRFPWLTVVIGIVPSDVVWEGWGSSKASGETSSFAWRGKALPFTPYEGMDEAIAALSRGERRSLTLPHLDGRRDNPTRAAAARIKVERFTGAMLVAGADGDLTWPSGEMTRAIAERRAEHGLPTVSLTFLDAGHGLSGTGWSPINYDPADRTVAGTARAQKKVWKEVQEFLHAHLGPPQIKR